MSRLRTPITLAALLTSSAVVVAACGDDGESSEDAAVGPVDLAEQSLVVSNWADYMPEDLPERFSSDVGPDIEIVNHATNEEIVATLTASQDSGIDVAFVSGQFAQALAAQGLLEPIDPDLVPNLTNLYSEATDLPYDPGNQFSVPYAWGTTGLCYREDLVSQAPTSWNDLLQPSEDLVGRTTMLQTDRWLMLPAQKALGFSVNTTDEDEMAQVQEVLTATKDTLLAYDDTTFWERLINDEAAMVQAWDGWCNYGIAENEQITFVVPEEGSDLWVDTRVILGTTEDKQAAHAFLNYILDPEIHTWVVENILYKVPNEAAMGSVDPALFEAYPNLAITPEELLTQEALVDLGDAAPLYTEIATEIAAE